MKKENKTKEAIKLLQEEQAKKEQNFRKELSELLKKYGKTINVEQRIIFPNA